MKPLTYDDRMRLSVILMRNAGKRAAFEANVKMAKKLLGKDKIKIISNHPEKGGRRMKPLVFDPKKHRYARLSDGTIEPLFYSDGKGGLDLTKPRWLCKAEFGRWYLDFDRFVDCNTVALMHMRITEFLEEKE